MKTIDDFLINSDTVPDYFAMINIADVTDQLHAFFFGKDSAGEKIGNATYVRVGYNRPEGTGTLITRGEFSLFFDIYMDDLLTYDQWAELRAANMPDEGIV